MPRPDVGWRDRFVAFVAERFPFALRLAQEAWDDVADRPHDSEQDVEALRAPLREALHARLKAPDVPAALESTPRVAVAERLQQEANRLVAECDGFLRREAIGSSLTPAERREML